MRFFSILVDTKVCEMSKLPTSCDYVVAPVLGLRVWNYNDMRALVAARKVVVTGVGLAGCQSVLAFAG